MISTYRKLFQILTPYERRRAYVLLTLFLITGLAATAGVASIMPFMAVVGNPEVIETNRYLSYVYERFGFTSDNAFLVFLGIVVFVALVGSQVVAAFTHWFLYRFTQMCNYRLSTRLMGSYFNRPYVWFLNRHSADLGRAVLSEVSQMVSQALLPSMKFLSKSVVALCLLGLVIVADPLIALTAGVVLGGAYTGIYLAVRHRLGRLGVETYQTNELRYRISSEALGGIKDVKVSGLESAYLDRYRSAARRYAQRQATHQIISQMPKFLLEALAFGGMMVIVLVLLIARDGGLGTALPVMAVYAFAGYRLMPALQEIYRTLSAMRFGNRVLERVHGDLLASKHTPGLPAAAELRRLEPLPLTRELQLRDIHFTYPDAPRKALDGLDISIPVNTTVGFVGTTGAGKTTVVDIILGLLKPDSGELLVDGQPVTADNLRRWQRTVGYVPQQIFLVDDTVAANIAFGEAPDQIDMAAVERAARAAELHEFVTEHLPHGYDTTIGERGVRLSGGQRQRIGIARALYSDPGVLVLDEATSALDNVTERAVMSAVTSLGRSKTVIMIAHRLSTVRDCDTIHLLEHGRLVASGTYDELARTSPTFRAMADGAA